ncbi:MAG: universal stress protein [Bryobacteraceae bacterium]
MLLQPVSGEQPTAIHRSWIAPSITGIPAIGTGGQYTMTLNDNAGWPGSASQTLTLNVEEGPADHQSESGNRVPVRVKKETTCALRHLLQELSIDASLHVLEGTIGEVIRQGAAMEDGDLVVIGRGHLDEPSGHLRTHAYEIIWNSPCPVLSL